MKFHLNIASRLLLIGALMAGGAGLSASDLVILHTTDPHSMIDPDAKGTGGVLQRKAIIDSVRNAEQNVLLGDAGDMVQGTLYFKFFGGDVEYPLMNMMDYDVQILGNHEFDNGLKAMADHYRTLDA
ncbi:MAG: metallophosphoesterase, partial [Muribaculaceae bacterium]|nr:metallophosphoesterase [Muribaculaceae bacterium]